MGYVLRDNENAYFEGIGRDNISNYILTNEDIIKARVFTLKEVRDGIVNDIIYKAHNEYHIQFSLIYVEESDVFPDTYKKIFNVFKGQLSKGVEKYGQDVDKSDLSTEEWVDHSLEELADLMVYLSKFKESMEKIK